MKQLFLLLLAMHLLMGLVAQVTLINSNGNLNFISPLDANKSIFSSSVNGSIWVSDGTLAGTIQLSPDIDFNANIGVLNGKFIFAGSTAATGNELYMTDGTIAGTVLLKDINPGVASSNPEPGGPVLNGFMYFIATRPAEGRELWKTNGTDAGTDILKDIVPGGGDSRVGFVVSTGTYLLFQAVEPGLGLELFKSDGTAGGTALLKDINTGPDSSAPAYFVALNANTILFTAYTTANGRERWKTDGSTGGTVILKDINPAGGSIPFLAGEFFFLFGGKAYFNANNGANGDELWSTDGTTANTVLFKEFEPGPAGSLNLIFDAVTKGSKFFFPSTNLFGSRSEIVESDGTTGGTQTFMDFTSGGEIPILLPNYEYFSQTLMQSLFQGDKFFFTAATPAEGTELWISNGTVPGTQIVKDINPGPVSGIDGANFSYIYTSSDLFFPANNGVNGLELWRSSGTSVGTSMVADIVLNAPGSEPMDMVPLLVNRKVLFQANNKDIPTETDLYAVNGVFDPVVVPVKLMDFTVQSKAADALLRWSVSQEINCMDYTVQRSEDGKRFTDIGTVPASGNSTTALAYSFTDANITANSSRIIYYRLLITDLDRTTAVSPIITLKLDKTLAWEAKLINNPVVDQLRILLSGISDNVNVTILDHTGKRLGSYAKPAINGQLTVPVEKLSRGSYVLVVQVGEDRRVLRFVK